MLKLLTVTAALLLAAAPALAAPVLKPLVDVTGAVVTVADLFDNAGAAAGTALFRSPEPGTTGFVTIDDIREAARRAGIASFEAGTIVEVRVARTGTLVDEALLTRLIEDDLADRGIIAEGVSAGITFGRFIEAIPVQAPGAPVVLSALRYLPQSGGFSARFALAGRSEPLDIDGRIELEVEVPHLALNLPAGAVIGATDIDMRRVPLKFAESNGFARAGDLIGKALNRQTRAGMVLKVSDVSEPRLIGRNELVTLYFRKGALTLTVKGKALTAAGKGETVSVLNTTSNKIVQGIVVSAGTVEITADPLRLAGL